MSKVSIVAKFRASTREGKAGSIYYNIYYDRIVRTLKSKYKLFPHEWDSEADCVVMTDCESARAQRLSVMNDMIESDIRRYHTLAKQMMSEGRLNCCDDLVVECRRMGRGETFISFAQRQIMIRDKSEKWARTARKNISSIRSFARFCKGVMLDDVTPSLIESYESYLKENNVSFNTISFYMRNLRSIYNKAVEQGLTSKQNPFEEVYAEVANTVRKALIIEEIRCIKEWDCSANDKMAYARDIFLFSFYTQGMQFADIASLRKSDIVDGVLRYQRSQKGQMIHIAWDSYMQEIVERYGVESSPYLLSILQYVEGQTFRQVDVTKGLARVNSGLKMLSAEMDLPLTLTFKIARNSWAMAAHSKSVPVSIITQSLGYADDSYTRRHLASIENSVDHRVLII